MMFVNRLELKLHIPFLREAMIRPKALGRQSRAA
jgi:hypothetical protein